MNRNKFLQMATAVIVFIGLSALLIYVTRRPNAGQIAEGPHEGAVDGPGQESHAEAKAAAGQPREADVNTISPADFNDFKDVICEHGLPILMCDQCRYEVGVAKLDPNLAGGLVETKKVEVRDQALHELALTGEVQLDLTRVVDIASVGSGRVESIFKIIGDNVAANDLLAVIQSSELGQAQAQFLENRAKLILAKGILDREKKLFEAKIGSEADYLEAQNAAAAATAMDAASTQRLQLFGFTDSQVQEFFESHPDESFGRLTLISPIKGTIVQQNIVRGQLVDTTDTLCRVADLSKVWIWCDVYESDLSLLQKHISAGHSISGQVYVKAYPDTVFKASVETVGNEVDQITRTLKIRMSADNAEYKLKPGMYVEVKIRLPEIDSGKSMTVPDSAVLTDEGRHFVFAKLTDDLWIRRNITVGRMGSGTVQVLSGLNQGDTIATKGAFMFKSEVLKEKMGAGCAE